MICEHLAKNATNGNVKLLSYEVVDISHNGWLSLKLLRSQQYANNQFQDLPLDDQPGFNGLLTARRNAKTNEIYLRHNKEIISNTRDKVSDLEQLLNEEEQSIDNTETATTTKIPTKKIRIKKPKIDKYKEFSKQKEKQIVSEIPTEKRTKTTKFNIFQETPADQDMFIRSSVL